MRPVFRRRGAPLPIDTIGVVSGGTIGVGAEFATINLLAGINPSRPGQIISVQTDRFGQAEVGVSVVNGSFDASGLTYTVNPSGLMTLNAAQFSKVAPGTTVTLGFDYMVVDTSGAKAPEKAVVTIDGGSAISYGNGGHPFEVGSGPVTVTPSVISPEHGDSFAIDPPGVLLITQKGNFGSATIYVETGVVVYTPSAEPGTAGTDTFTVSDKDGAGVTTKTELQFSVDGGTAVTYGQTNASTSPVVVVPVLISPEGQDVFSFANGNIPSLTITGKYGTAQLSPTNGAITYTPTAPPGTGGTDRFSVYDTDAHHVTTSTTATFVVENYVAPTISGTLAGQTTASEQTVAPFSGVAVTDINIGATDTLTIALTGQGTLSGPGLSLTNGGYTLSGSAEAITGDLHALVFTPAAGAYGTQHATTFRLTDASSLTPATAVELDDISDGYRPGRGPADFGNAWRAADKLGGAAGALRADCHHGCQCQRHGYSEHHAGRNGLAFRPGSQRVERELYAERFGGGDHPTTRGAGICPCGGGAGNAAYDDVHAQRSEQRDRDYGQRFNDKRHRCGLRGRPDRLGNARRPGDDLRGDA